MTSRRQTRLASRVTQAREANDRLFARAEKRAEWRRELGLDKPPKREPQKIRSAVP